MYKRLVAVATIAIAFSAPLTAQGARERCRLGAMGVYEERTRQFIKDCTDSLKRWKGGRDYTHRGYGHMAEKRFDKAYEDFRRGIVAPGKHRYQANNGMGDLWLKLGESSRARHYYERSLKEKPGHQPALIGRAEAYAKSKDYDAARKAYKDILDKPWRPEKKGGFYYDREYHMDAWAREIARREYRKLKGY